MKLSPAFPKSPRSFKRKQGKTEQILKLNQMKKEHADDVNQLRSIDAIIYQLKSIQNSLGNINKA